MRVSKEYRHLPILLGFERSNISRALSVWCPYCSEWHNHGEEMGHVIAHVIAHCIDLDSPFKESGYYIKKISKRDMDRLVAVCMNGEKCE